MAESNETGDGAQAAPDDGASAAGAGQLAPADAAASETASDAANDSATETASETATETATDAATETATDSATETANETASETATDAATDAASDSATEAASETVGAAGVGVAAGGQEVPAPAVSSPRVTGGAGGAAAASEPPTGRARLVALVQRYELALVAVLALAILLPGLGSFQLIDPWETHYGEVGRRILEDDDWVHLKWQDEEFRSKPILTFWLNAGSMALFGVATDGGYSGELTSGDLPTFAVRLPFALFGALGLVLIWWMLAALVNRRVAWLSFLVLATTPFYLLVARQAITDMPMIATLIGAVSCFAMAVCGPGDRPLVPFWRRLTAHHVLLACVGVFVVFEGIYHIGYFHFRPGLARGVGVPLPGWLLGGGAILAYAGVVAWSLVRPPRTRRGVYLGWGFVCIGITILAKGPVGLGIALATAGLYIALSGRWRLVADWDLLRGVLLAALVMVPWHLAMWFKAGGPWVKEYFGYHMGTRIAEGAHGDRGTFDYFSSILGVGMWPWGVLVPAALAALLLTRARTQRGTVQLIVGIWAIVAFALFAISKTKFHHYVLPVVPPLAVLIAMWLDDVLRGRGGRVWLFALLGATLSLLITRDLIGEPKQIIEMFIYRHDRPWPSGKPWWVDVSGPIVLFGVAAALSLLVFAVPRRRVRSLGLGLLSVTAVGSVLWAANDYMGEAAPHWGQRELHRTYYAKRQIHGVEIKYFSLRDLADQWQSAADDFRVESVLPEDFEVGLPMTIRILVPGAGVPEDKVELRGTVSRIGHDEFWIRTSIGERARLRDLVDRGRKPGVARGRRPWVQVDADRLIAWQLNWRGENFWSNGEIFGDTADTQTVFDNTNNVEFLKYIKDPSRPKRTYFVITESGRASSLKGVLPTQRAKDTVEILDTSCNKFTLLRFTL